MHVNAIVYSEGLADRDPRSQKLPLLSIPKV
jgi:hypothetical protein